MVVPLVPLRCAVEAAVPLGPRIRAGRVASLLPRARSGRCFVPAKAGALRVGAAGCDCEPPCDKRPTLTSSTLPTPPLTPANGLDRQMGHAKDMTLGPPVRRSAKRAFREPARQCS